MDLPDFTATRAELHGDRTALVDVTDDRAVTYAVLDDRAGRLARVLRDEWGVGAGDRVAMLARDRAETFDALFACAKLSAVFVPLNWRLSVDELVPIVADAEPVGLLSDATHDATATRLREAAGLARSFAFGDDALGTEAALEPALTAATGPPLRHGPHPDDRLWYLLYTSGTTGRPKGVCQTYGMAVVNHLNIGTTTGLTDADTLLSVLPHFHTAGINLYTLPMLLVGGTTLITGGFDPAQVLDLLARRATVFFGVPTIYQLLADHPDFDATNLSGVRSWGCGGAPMPVALLERYAARGIVVRQGMGMTETGPAVFLIDEEHAVDKAGSVGRPLPFVEVRVVDGDGVDVADGEPGELLIRGPGITPGYWRRPDATAEAFAPDGWLHSGDVARRDDDGYVHIVDRWKDMYISGGENVYPAEVEQVLHRLKEVADCAVVGAPDDRWGEVGAAFVVPAHGATVDPDALRDHCRAHLARYKVPRHVVTVDELPRTAAGKVRKGELRSGFAVPVGDA